MIKSTVTEKTEPTESLFPKLMVAENGQIVLFYKNECGVVVGDNSHQVGLGSTSFAMAVFTDFTGTVTLSNGGE